MQSAGRLDAGASRILRWQQRPPPIPHASHLAVEDLVTARNRRPRRSLVLALALLLGGAVLSPGPIRLQPADGIAAPAKR